MKKKHKPVFFCFLLIVLSYCNKPKENGTEDSVANPIPEVVHEPNEDRAKPDSTVNYELLVNEYEDPDRGQWQNPALVIEKLGDTGEKVVADIGAGTGYFTFPLASVSKRVIAIDIESTFLDYIEDLKLDYPWHISEVIETRLSVENDPMLENEEVDAVLMVNVYSYLNNRIEYMKKVKQGLKDGGIVLIVDFKKGDMPVGPEDELKVSEKTVSEELKKAGFTIVETDTEGLDYQYIVKAK